ncbi:hypothetical protein DEJ48_20125 [Streptomyces venezuelae]|uniref:Uncharacterized protein n=1 Tax=Streptomyces venezuelae TaxID=54571 RepID=A0A5P2BY38_STRVZ|nr:hypothetical protein DEJ48_20125 [Streptomyces venezuelae]
MIDDASLPAVGTLMVDARNGRSGIVMDHVGPYVQLRPSHGGTEWDVPPDELCKPSQSEELSSKVSVANRRWGL